MALIPDKTGGSAPGLDVLNRGMKPLLKGLGPFPGQIMIEGIFG
jgi:hypothetical protein